MEFYHNIVCKQALHRHRKIYFFRSSLFHISNKQNDLNNIFYYRLYKLKQDFLVRREKKRNDLIYLRQ
jgi:hypothetical protein